LYVDDLVLIGNAENLSNDIKNDLSKEFEIKDPREMHYCLGIEVWRE
jgi:hypothetical protein